MHVIVAALTSFVTSAVLSWGLSRHAPRLGYVDRPSDRKLHHRPIPLLGGVAIMVATGVGILVLWRYHGALSVTSPVAVELCLAMALGVYLGAVGLHDDRRELHTAGKVLALLPVGAVVSIHLILSPSDGSLRPFDAAFACVFILGLVNTINFLDNMDGLLAGVAVVTAAALSVSRALGVPTEAGSPLQPLVPVALAGACAGFLVLNVRPARIFMGDAGSLFIGGFMGTLGLLAAFAHPVAPVGAGLPGYSHLYLCLLFGLPICDGGLVTISRLAHRRHLTRGAKDHLSHRLVALGMSERGAVAALWGASAVWGAAAVAFGVTASPYIPAGIALLALPLLGRLFRAPVYPGQPVETSAPSPAPTLGREPND